MLSLAFGRSVSPILAAVAMLSAGLAVPMQQASASSDGGNSLKINQENDCERAFCSNYLNLDNEQSIEED
jgi:hypothetical protein